MKTGTTNASTRTSFNIFNIAITIYDICFRNYAKENVLLSK